MKDQVKSITKKSQDISIWYNDVIERGGLAEHGPVKGTMIWRPLGYALWENIQKGMDVKIKDLGVQNVYFPLFIPEKFFKREKEHVKGFSPELAVVTHGGGEKLSEPIVVRPTSETIMYDAFSRWISSYKDLPLKVNQWANVVRWEKRPYFFLRTTEFLWQEGHTAHKDNEDAQRMVNEALEMYVNFYQTNLSLFGYAGVKSDAEKFAGADKTFTYEMLMPDGRIVQGCTSHNLGQNFAKVFKVTFTNPKGEQHFVYQTSWGYSTRSIGAMIMVHGDDNGLVIPPLLAPLQVVIIPIVSKDSDKEAIENLCRQVFQILESMNITNRVDDSDQSAGWKFNQHDLQGVPLRVEVGATEVRTKRLRVVRRDNKQSADVLLEELGAAINQLLDEVQKGLFERHKKFTLENTRQSDSYDRFKEIMKTTRGFIEAFWCEDPKCEEKIKEETKATTRCLPLDSIKANGQCVYCGKKADYRWLFGQSY